jgi:hypothetical protein
MQIVYSASRRALLPLRWKFPSLQATAAVSNLWRAPSWRWRSAVASLVVAALGCITLWISLPVQQQSPVQNVDHAGRVSSGDSTLETWPGESSATHWLSDALQDTLSLYYLTVQREVVSQIVGTQPTELLHTLRTAVEALWDEVEVLDTPEALIGYFRTVGLALIAERLEVTRANSIPQRPPAWDSRLEAAAIKQGLVEALSKGTPENAR